MAMSEAVKGAENIAGWYTIDRLRALELLARSSVGYKGKVIEVGTWLGRSAYVLAYAASLNDGELICVDTWRGLPQDPTDPRYEIARHTNLLAEARRNLSLFGDKVRFEVGESSIVLPSFPSGYADLVHLDGDHSHPVIDEDVESGWRILRPGGVLCGDDYDETDVWQAVASLGITPDVYKEKLWWVVKSTGAPVESPS
jgi:predicted O-methyltransferase YrrM